MSVGLSGAVVVVALLAAGLAGLVTLYRSTMAWYADAWTDFVQAYLALDETGDVEGAIRRAEQVVHATHCSDAQRSLALVVLNELRRRAGAAQRATA